MLITQRRPDDVVGVAGRGVVKVVHRCSNAAENQKLGEQARSSTHMQVDNATGNKTDRKDFNSYLSTHKSDMFKNIRIRFCSCITSMQQSNTETQKKTPILVVHMCFT